MAKRKSKSIAGPSITHAASTEAPDLGALEDTVEQERARLMKAHAILNCVVIAMEDEGLCTGDGPYYPAVIESARDLVNESINRLDAVGLALMSAKLLDSDSIEVPEALEPGGKYEVREPSGYLC
jgi:hypothetical protein